MKTTLELGEIIVNDVTLIYDEDNFKVVWMDCKSKRPVVNSYSIIGKTEEIVIALSTGEHTLAPSDDPDLQGMPTRVYLTWPGIEIGHWTHTVDQGRYSVYLTAYRIPDALEGDRQLWKNPDGD